MKIYFFPGLGADSSLAPFHILPGIEVQWIDWPIEFGKSWDDFIREILIENKFEPDSVFAGISFGGLVAQRLAHKIKPRKIILIGSLQSSKDISPLLKTLSHLARFVPSTLFKFSLLPTWLIRYYFGIEKAADLSLFLKMASKIDGKMAKTLINLALSYSGIPVVGFPIQIIHGTADKIIPWKNKKKGTEISGGGHLISMTHSNQINEAILNRIKE
jgi:pimeloyl-ACP methyl ester carboxylesterase